jgi:flagellar protein FlaG
MTGISNIAQVAQVTEAASRAATPVRGRPEVMASGKGAAKELGTSSAATKPDAPSVNAAVVKLNESLKQEQGSLQFSVDQASGRMVIKVTDTETNEVIRQIPPEQVLDLMHSLTEGSGDAGRRGLLLRTTV